MSQEKKPEPSSSYSPNVLEDEFSEVRIAPILCHTHPRALGGVYL